MNPHRLTPTGIEGPVIRTGPRSTLAPHELDALQTLLAAHDLTLAQVLSVVQRYPRTVKRLAAEAANP